MQQKLSELGDSLSELRKEGVPEPTATLFAGVKGYQTPPQLTPIQAAHNLWATLNYAFVSPGVNSKWGKIQVGANSNSIKTYLFDSANILQEGEMVTDEATKNLATIFQKFFSKANELDQPTRDKLTWALGGDSVEIFERLRETFNMAKHRYELNQNLEQKLTALEKQITNSLTPPDPKQLDQFRQSALALLPGNQQLNSTGNIIDETFAKHHETEWKLYLESISALDTKCFELYNKLHPFRDKFIEERNTCTQFINTIIQRVNALPASLAAQQKKIEEEKAKQTQPPESLPEQPVQEEKPPISSPVTSTAGDLSEILALQEQIALLNSELTTAENEWQSLKEKKPSLETEKAQITQSLSESNRLAEEQEKVEKQISEITQLQTEIKNNQLNNESINNNSTLRLLNTDKATLEVYLQQQAKQKAEQTSWMAWGWGVSIRAVQWAIGTTPSLPYPEQKENFIHILDEQITSETQKQTQLAEAIKQREADEEKLTKLNNELAALVKKQEALATLKEKQTNLQVTLQQTQEKYFAKQALMDSMKIVAITTYEDSGMPSTPSKAESEKEKNLREKKEKLNAAKIKLDSLLDDSDSNTSQNTSQENLKLILILVALAAYLQALVDYHTYNTELGIKGSLKQLKTEVKSTFAKPLPKILGGLFSESIDKADKNSENESVQQSVPNQDPSHNPKNL